MATNPKYMIHEVTRNLTKQHESMLIYDALSVVRFEPESFCAKVSKDHG